MLPLSPMISRALLAAWLLGAAAQAGPFVVRVTEVATGEVSFHRVATQPLEVTEISPVEGRALDPISKYAVLGRKLVANKVPLTDADEVLCQFTRAGADFVIVCREESSPSNLFGSFLASVGLYSPVSKVSVVRVKDGKLVARKRLVRKTASFEWKAAAFDDAGAAAR